MVAYGKLFRGKYEDEVYWQEPFLNRGFEITVGTAARLDKTTTAT